jgi:hypothetical protein
VSPVLVTAGDTGYPHVQFSRVGSPHQCLADGPASNDPYRLGHVFTSSAFYPADKMLPF